MILVILYLLAIVLANVLVTLFGPSVSIITSFVFIGANITMRDFLHVKWMGDKRKMFLLILAGSLLSGFFGAGRIAIASFLAFFISEGVDYIIYTRPSFKTKLERTMKSNYVSALLDSLIFPTIAFGFPIMWAIVFGNYLAKIAGGFWWFHVIEYFSKK